MSRLSVKVGDKGTYSGGMGACEVVFVKSNGEYFVTSSAAFVPQVHGASGANLNHVSSATFDFVPTPRTIKVAVWASSDGAVHHVATLQHSCSYPGCKHVEIEVPQ